MQISLSFVNFVKQYQIFLYKKKLYLRHLPIKFSEIIRKQDMANDRNNEILRIILFVIHSEKVTSCLANIHSFVLRDCAQLPWAVDLSEEININQVKVEKKKDQQIVKFLPAKVPNLPYSKVLLQERIK